MKGTLCDARMMQQAPATMDLMTDVQASTEYSIVGKDLDGTIGL